MQIKNFAALAAFFVTSLALPTAGESPNFNETSALEKRQYSPGNRCGDSLFVDRTSGASPTIDNCRFLAAAVRAASSHQVDYVNDYLPNTDEDPLIIASVHGCRFGIRKAYHGPQRVLAAVGWTDIVDLIEDSIRKFGRHGQVGSEGAMVCDPNEGVWWGVF